jgi:hypothetical protein
VANTVFILGAGASKDAGVPLMNNFLDVARDLLAGGSLGEYQPHFETVFRGINKLRLAHSNSQLDIENVESVFSAFEMAKILGKFADYSPDQIDDLTRSMRLLIVETIQQRFRLPFSNGVIHAPSPYASFADIVRNMRHTLRPNRSIAIITFNYDMGLDLAFHLYGLDVRYGLRNDENQKALPLLKLHGSLNWGQVKDSREVVPWYLSEYFRKYNWGFVHPNASNVRLNIGTNLRQFEYLNQTMLDEPMIVPPTWSKSGYHTLLSPVWATAARELSEAENIFVIGYSLPPSDSFFRYLYALGTIGDTPIRRFWVINPDDSGAVSSRFRDMLGPGAVQRYDYKPIAFSQSIQLIEDELKGNN